MLRTASPAAPRVDWVDVAKGLCIIMVVMMHSTLGVEKAAEAQGFMHHAVAFAKPFRMPDFFLISGLFLAVVIDRDWRTYADRKVLHFFYFYLLWLVIQGAFKWPGLALDEGFGAVVHEFLLSLINPFGTLWFIYLLPVFFVFAKLVRRVPPVLVLAFAAALEMAPIETGWMAPDEFAARLVYVMLGWYGAPYVFALAERVQAHRGLALGGLAVWALVNGAAVSGGISELPGVGLALGVAGAVAVIAVAGTAAGAPLRYAGARSIVVYLAFFLPMAVTRTILIKTGIIPDVGWMAVVVTTVGVIAPLVFERLVMATGWGTFLFVRPQALRIEQARDPRDRRLQPAE